MRVVRRVLRKAGCTWLTSVIYNSMCVCLAYSDNDCKWTELSSWSSGTSGWYMNITFNYVKSPLSLIPRKGQRR